jgi:hypothetical protein
MRLSPDAHDLHGQIREEGHYQSDKAEGKVDSGQRWTNLGQQRSWRGGWVGSDGAEECDQWGGLRRRLYQSLTTSDIATRIRGKLVVELVLYGEIESGRVGRRPEIGVGTRLREAVVGTLGRWRVRSATAREWGS